MFADAFDILHEGLRLWAASDRDIFPMDDHLGLPPHAIYRRWLLAEGRAEEARLEEVPIAQSDFQILGRTS